MDGTFERLDLEPHRRGYEVEWKFLPLSEGSGLGSSRRLPEWKFPGWQCLSWQLLRRSGGGRRCDVGAWGRRFEGVERSECNKCSIWACVGTHNWLQAKSIMRN